MIVGNGFIASAIRNLDRDGLTIFAAGVANSGCCDFMQFERERAVLLDSLLRRPDRFVYFSTCAISGPQSDYFTHKARMESLVRSHRNYLILRLPPVAGKSSNPHTLFNFLRNRITTGDKFMLHSHARRYVIGIDEVVTLTKWALDSGLPDSELDLVSPVDYSAFSIVESMERALGRKAVYEVAQCGERLLADPSKIAKAPVDFSGDYLSTITSRYYS